MKYKVVLKGTGSYSQSKFFTSTKKDGETPNEFEARCWREKAHVDKDGFVVVPVFSLKAALDYAASYLGLPVPGGGGKRTFAKLFRSAVRPQSSMPHLLIGGKKTKIAEAHGEWINANSDGRRGSGKRVPRCFPLWQDWSCVLEFDVLDSRVTKEIFLSHLAAAGVYTGIGRFRPENGGSHGCFSVWYADKEIEPPAVELPESNED